MIRLFLAAVFAPIILAYPGNWQYEKSVWDQGAGFTFTYDPAFVIPFRGGIRLFATSVESSMSWHGGGIHQLIQPFGYIEVKARLPKGAGLWPALFLFSFADRREVDIFEMIDPQCQNLQLTVHDTMNVAQVNHEYIGNTDLSKGYHYYGFKWTPKLMIWYLDGKQIWQTDQYIPQEAMDLYLVLSAGGWAGLPDDNTSVPAYFDIAYIRIWIK